LGEETKRVIENIPHSISSLYISIFTTMKPIVVFLLLLPMFCTAQKKDSLVCRGIIDTAKDKPEGKVTTQIKSPIKILDSAGTEVFSIMLSRESWVLSGKTYYMHILVRKGSACLDDDAPVTLVFKNGKKQKMYSVSNFNCKGEALITLNMTFGGIKKYQENAVSGLSIGTRNSHIDGTFSAENAQLFQQYLSCLAK